MTKKNVEMHFQHPVLVVGPAEVDFSLLKLLMNRGHQVVAADGGANALLKLGITPTAIVGDMDSIDPALLEGLEIRLVTLEEQDTSDFEKCVYSINAPLVLAIGFTGRRLDHTLASIHVANKYHPDLPILLINREDISFVVQGDFTFAGNCGQPISIFPLHPIEFEQSTGLEFILDNLVLTTGTRIGTSNTFDQKHITICPAPAYAETPYLVTMPITMLDLVIDHFS